MCSTHTIEMLESWTNSMLYLVMPTIEVVIEVSCVYFRLLARSSIISWLWKLEFRNWAYVALSSCSLNNKCMKDDWDCAVIRNS